MSRPRGLYQVQPRGPTGQERGLGAQPGTPRPPPPAGPHLPAPAGPSSLPARFSRRRAPGARPCSPRPGAAALLTPNFTAALAREHRRRRGPWSHRHRAAGSGAHDGLPAHCARVPALPQTPDGGRDSRAGTPSPRRLQVPAGPARVLEAWRAGLGGVFLVQGRRPRARWGGPRAERWALALRCILGFVVFEDHGVWLGVGTQGSLVSPPRTSRHRDLYKNRLHSFADSLFASCPIISPGSINSQAAV